MEAAVLASGYLVVRKSEPRQYRGLYRKPPWDAEAYAQGFRDPYIFGNLAHDAGLFVSEGKARTAKRMFERRYGDQFETLFVSRDENEIPGNVLHLGHDVADSFGSFFSELVNPGTFLRLSEAGALNDNGLIAQRSVAASVLRDLLPGEMQDLTDPVLWTVYLLSASDQTTARGTGT